MQMFSFCSFKENTQSQIKIVFLDELFKERQKMNSITKFIIKFLSENGSEDLIDEWNTQKNLDTFNIIVKNSKINDPKKESFLSFLYLLKTRHPKTKQLILLRANSLHHY
jgi:predicted nucleic acid-binding protein